MWSAQCGDRPCRPGCRGRGLSGRSERALQHRATVRALHDACALSRWPRTACSLALQLALLHVQYHCITIQHLAQTSSRLRRGEQRMCLKLRASTQSWHARASMRGQGGHRNIWPGASKRVCGAGNRCDMTCAVRTCCRYRWSCGSDRGARGEEGCECAPQAFVAKPLAGVSGSRSPG